MEQFIGCDAHKKFSVFVAVNEKGQAGAPFRVLHNRQLYRDFLAQLPPRSAIALEARSPSEKSDFKVEFLLAL